MKVRYAGHHLENNAHARDEQVSSKSIEPTRKRVDPSDTSILTALASRREAKRVNLLRAYEEASAREPALDRSRIDAERVKRYRLRRKLGLTCVTVDIGPEHLAGLVRSGLLQSEIAQAGEIKVALESFLALNLNPT